MSAELVQRANAMRAHYAEKERHKGTGYHDEDRDHVRPDRFVAPQKNGLPKASESVVPFFDHQDLEEVHFVGRDAELVLMGLQQWAMRPGNDAMSPVGTVRKMAVRTIPRLKIKDSQLTIKLADWNDVLYALDEMKICVLGAPLVDDGTTPK